VTETVGKGLKSNPAETSLPAEKGRNGRNRPKFYLRWNWAVSRTGLHTGMRFSVRSGRNGTEYTTLARTRVEAIILDHITFDNGVKIL
jgi:hypothetical protein